MPSEAIKAREAKMHILTQVAVVFSALVLGLVLGESLGLLALVITGKGWLMYACPAAGGVVMAGLVMFIMADTSNKTAAA
jgi:hypothetical protein